MEPTKQSRLPIRDARAIAQDISLEREGFTLLCHPSSVRDFYDDDEVRRVYYPEAEKREILVKTDNAGLPSCSGLGCCDFQTQMFPQRSACVLFTEQFSPL